MNRLVTLPEEEFRDLLRGVCRKRWGMLGKVRRLHIRFGIYQESKGGSTWQAANRRAVWQVAGRQIRRVGKVHVWQGYTAHGLSWIAQLLRKLDRAARLERARKEREAQHGAA